MSYQDEPQAGGLLDGHWLVTRIIVPLFLIGLLVGIIYWIGYSCPYTEDVSSCFPYNLPDWVKIVLPLALIIIPIMILILIFKIGFLKKGVTE